MGICALAGITYGFSGFGSALIFMPLAVRAVEPATALAAFALAALGSIATVVPDAVRRADLRASGVILLAALATLPMGVLVLRIVPADALRWAISLIVLITLVFLMIGWRYRGRAGPPAWLGIGAAVGMLGGATGLSGPPLVLFQLAGRDGAARSRANTIVVLSLTGFAVLPVMAMQGIVGRDEITLGLILLPVYALAGWIGKRLFTPARGGLYRTVAYGIVGAAAVMGLPIWG